MKKLRDDIHSHFLDEIEIPLCRACHWISVVMLVSGMDGGVPHEVAREREGGKEDRT